MPKPQSNNQLFLNYTVKSNSTCTSIEMAGIIFAYGNMAVFDLYVIWRNEQQETIICRCYYSY